MSMRFLNEVTTLVPASHPWIEWRARNRVAEEVVALRMENQRLSQQLIGALQVQLVIGGPKPSESIPTTSNIFDWTVEFCQHNRSGSSSSSSFRLTAQPTKGSCTPSYNDNDHSNYTTASRSFVIAIKF